MRINFNIDIPDGQAQEILRMILVAAPIPVNEDGAPQFTQNQWLQQLHRQHWRSLYRRGVLISRQQENIDDGIIT